MNNLAELLEASGRPDWEVAAAVGIHPTQLSFYKCGKRIPHDRHAGWLAAYFGVSIDVVKGDKPIPWAELEGAN